MPTKKKTKKRKGTSRRRRVGAIDPKSAMIKVAAIAGGFLIADKANGAIATHVDPKILAGGEAVVGAALLFAPGKKTMIRSIAGGALLGMGLKTGLRAFGVINGRGINGYGNVPVVGRRMLSGYQAVPVIGGYSPGGTLGNYAVNGRMKDTNVMGSMSGGSGLNRQD